MGKISVFGLTLLDYSSIIPFVCGQTKLFCGKDHTTVMHSVDKIKKEVEKDENLNIDIQRLVNQIQWKK